jgi:hypothetical protein
VMLPTSFRQCISAFLVPQRDNQRVMIERVVPRIRIWEDTFMHVTPQNGSSRRR